MKTTYEVWVNKMGNLELFSYNPEDPRYPWRWFDYNVDRWFISFRPNGFADLEYLGEL